MNVKVDLDHGECEAGGLCYLIPRRARFYTGAHTANLTIWLGEFEIRKLSMLSATAPEHRAIPTELCY